ncbi:hypothetical protein OIU77_027379 [Salix suchowensis]|uniref:Uncharacterized protein n=1 Tax=Salix suchowensis TaxID=1278906 RepID=A0ABQ9BSA3_9ROSI|nr:hypothetical protein OIU77_027379 [Salix suchowensis]
MVLWEITLGTAYFLGLKRTYKLALRIQRRLISRKYPRIRQFAQRMPNGFAQNVDQEHASDASSSILIILSVTQICSLLYISWTTSTGSISFMTSPLARVVSLHVCALYSVHAKTGFMFPRIWLFPPWVSISRL